MPGRAVPWCVGRTQWQQGRSGWEHCGGSVEMLHGGSTAGMAWPRSAPVCMGRSQWLLYSSSVRAGWEQCGGSRHQEEEAARGGTPGSGCVCGQCCSSVGAGQEGSMSVLPPLVPAAMP